MAPHKPISESSSYRSQKETIADLSVLEKLDTIPALLTVFANTITAIFTGVFRAKSSRPSSYYRYVALTTLRTMTRRTSPRQQHYLAAPTDDAYLTFCKKKGVQPNSVILEDGTRAHWIGNPGAENVVLNFHGGGYVFPAAPEMFLFMSQIVSRAAPNSLAILFLSYDLAPGAIYPRQLQQASALLHHVLTVLNFSPSNILLTGDSAGANLALGLLSHIKHPHPNEGVKKIDLKGEEIKGAVLISPWVDFRTDAPSFERNKYKDCIVPGAVNQWGAAFMGEDHPFPTKSDYYNHAATAPESWWEGLPVEKVLVVAGADEVLVDGIVEFEGRLRGGLGEGKVELRVVEGEYHDQMNIDWQLGYKESEEGEQARLIKRWIGSKL